MTTDTDALHKRIAQTVWEVCAGPFTPTISAASANEVAIALAPIVAEEVRKAKAEAWTETCEAFAWCITNGPIEDALPYVAEHNPYRAAETGDSDEH